MRLVVLYRKNSEQYRPVYEFTEMMRRRYPDKKLEEKDIDSREGAAEATIYGVMSYPAIIITAYDGRVIEMWQGLPMPLIDQVAGMMLETQSTTV